MKAMILETYGPEATFVAVERETPEAGAGEVLVKVAATSVNTVDTMIRQLGQEQLPLSPDLPAILGMDFAGTIEAIGEGVTGFRVGDEVYGCAGGLMALQGALAEYIPADARLIAHKPKSLSMKQAAALPLVSISAYEALVQKMNVKAGDNKLLIKLTGRPVMDLVPVSKTKFRSENTDFQIDFGINKNNKITKVMAIRNGDGRLATKIN